MRDLTRRVRTVYDARRVTILFAVILVVIVAGLAEARHQRNGLAEQDERIAAQAKRTDEAACLGATDSRGVLIDLFRQSENGLDPDDFPGQLGEAIAEGQRIATRHREEAVADLSRPAPQCKVIGARVVDGRVVYD
jgi:hypothetical protein